ncbi:MAG: Ig-like domain-containing protein, partial [Ginsengibacter sp.]
MKNCLFVVLFFCCNSCSKNKEPMQGVGDFGIIAVKIDTRLADRGNYYFNVNLKPLIRVYFSQPVSRSTVASNFTLLQKNGTPVPYSFSYDNKDSQVLIRPDLQFLSKYSLILDTGIKSAQNSFLNGKNIKVLITEIDSTDKFTRVTDDELLTNIQKQTFKYFWDFGHPFSGMARERNTSGDLVTTGGTGFGVMSILVGIDRNFISRSDGLQIISKIVTFLKDKCTR